MNKLTWIILIAAVVGIFALAASAGSGVNRPSSTQTERPAPKYQCTLTASQVTAVMMRYVKVTNENTGENFYIFYNDIPQSFNFAPGDVLSFNVTAKTGFTLNAWIFDDGTFSDANPLSLKPSKSFSMDARMMPLN
jgi:hypothetical protein